jgi:hypothetical protein
MAVGAAGTASAETLGAHAASEPPPSTAGTPTRWTARAASSRRRYSSGWAAISRRAAAVRERACRASRPGSSILRRAAGGPLAGPVDRAHARQRCRVLPPAAVGGLGASALVGLAVGRQRPVAAQVEGIGRQPVVTVGAELACVSNTGRRVATITLHLGVHSLGVAWPRGGSRPPRWPLSQRPRETRGSPDDSRFVSGTKRQRVKQRGTAWHQLGTNPAAQRDDRGSGGIGWDGPPWIEGLVPA